MLDTSCTAYIGLGSNLGRREAHLQSAIDRLWAPSVDVTAVSPVYETAPVGPIVDQPHFLNAVIEIVTTLSPLELLRRCLEVERRMGRERIAAKGPRIIDVDVLLAGSAVASSTELIVPHPALCERLFVLAPLLDLVPELRDPRDGRALSDYLGPLRGTQEISEARFMLNARAVARAV